MQSKKNGPQRSDAQRNRERILKVALAELTNSADTPLSVIARKACVGQGTFYRNFPNRETLVLEIYRHEMQQVADSAAELLETREPEQALREWMDRLARFGMAKAGLANAIQQATSGPGNLAKPGHALCPPRPNSSSGPTRRPAPSARASPRTISSSPSAACG